MTYFLLFGEVFFGNFCRPQGTEGRLGGTLKSRGLLYVLVGTAPTKGSWQMRLGSYLGGKGAITKTGLPGATLTTNASLINGAEVHPLE